MSDKKEKEPFFSAKNLKLLTSPFGATNPVTVQILGICSALAVTAKLKPAFVMALSVTIVTGFSSMIISLIRKGIPDHCPTGSSGSLGDFGRSGAEGLCL